MSDWPDPEARIEVLQGIVRTMIREVPPEFREQIAAKVAEDPVATTEFMEALGATGRVLDAIARRQEGYLS